MRVTYFSQKNVKNFSSFRFFMLIKLKILSFYKKEEGTEALKEN